MKKILLQAFIYSLVVMTLLFALTALTSKTTSYAIQEVIGYAGIVVSLLFVYFGIRQYRDKVNGGTLSFGQGLKVGLLIVLIPALLFGLFDILYTTFIDPDFLENYYNTHLANIKAQLPAAEFEAEAKKLEQQKEIFGNSFFQFGLMFLTVFMIGIIITVISALVLKRTKLSTQTA